MPTAAASSLSRITELKRPWNKLPGHSFHVFGRKCFVNGMFACASSAPAGRIRRAVGFASAGGKVHSRAGSRKKTTGLMGTAKNISQ